MKAPSPLDSYPGTAPHNDTPVDTEKYQSLLNHMQQGFCIIEVLFAQADQPLDYRFLEVNPAFEQQTGLSNAVGKTMRELQPAHEQYWFDLYAQVVNTRQPVYLGHQAAQLVGGVWYDGVAFPLEPAENHQVAILFQDISGRKQTEAALVNSEAKYRTLFDAIDEGFNTIEVLFDEQHKAVDCRILEINPAYSRLTGLGHQIVGQRLRTFLPSIEEGIIERYGQVAQTGEPVRFEEYVAGLDRWFDCYAVRIGGGSGHRLAVVFKDITERKRADEALRQAALRKDEFLAMLAHELRNPLAPIRNGLQLLAQTHQQDQLLSTMLPIMNRQMEHLMRMVDDLLDVSRISRGKIELYKQRIDLTQVIEQAVQAMQSLYGAADRQLNVQLPDNPFYVDGDATRLNQVVVNLLSNCLRYTHPGGQVWLSLERLGEQAALRVRDNGIGLAADQLGAIFELFVQVDTSLARSHGGLGVGLALVQQLVQQHGGRVEAHSPGLEAGSEFVVYLPLLLV